ncbi:MAG: sulfatase-like hydrolase/transferase [Anaerotignum sp.]|nr:sulfatase-like hydrolase/transferase [Anaerotignum sp.]
MSEVNLEKTEFVPVYFPKKDRPWPILGAASVFITGLVFLITSEHFIRLGIRILKNPTLLLFNILPVFLFMALTYFLSRRVLFSVTMTASFFILFAVIDKVKTVLRQEPLLPSDFTLAKEALTIVKTFPPIHLFLIGLLLVGLLAALVLSFRLSKNEKPIGKMQLLGCLIVIILGYGANTFAYSNTALYNQYPVIDNPYFQVNQYNSKGLIYSFCHQFNITRVTPPEGYDKATFDQLEKEQPQVSANNKPHIVMIMGEAFSDLSNNQNLDFSKYRDPLQNFKEMADSENAVSGKIVVPGYGGGTSNTEYDVLTACSTRYLNNPLPTYNFIHQPFDALPRRLAQIGYETQAIHPGYEWFYNRQNVYPYLGFETRYFLEDSFDLATQGVGGYVNETATMDKILETLDTHIKTEETPLFSFTVTIQNHGPFDNHYGSLPQSFDTDISLTEAERDLLTQYFKGITDADTQLGRLRDYAQASTEPIVVVYFGDHLPGFSNGMDFFSLLDYPIGPNGTLEERLALYETPFLIWQNDAAKEQCAFSETAKSLSLPASRIINAQYLGALLTQLLGMEGVSPLFDYANEARQILPVSTNEIFVDANGNYSESATQEQKDIVSKMKAWQYYKLFDQSLSK